MIRHLSSTALFTVILSAAAASQVTSPRSRVTDVTFPTEPPMIGASAVPIIAGVSAVRLPVLLPSGFLKARSLKFVGEALYYTASIRTNGASLAVNGTRVATDVEMGAAGVGDGDTAGDNFAEATKVENGAAYTVTVECDRPVDPRCTATDYVRSLLKDLAFVGGSREPAPPLPQLGSPPPLIGASANPGFSFKPPGELLVGSGQGITSETVHVPGLRFPVEQGPAYLNSQVWGIGGARGPRGGWNDVRNYAYPWRDNFCESRSRSTTMCPSSKGHQGVDIRPANSRKSKHWAVAVEAGRIHRIGSYSVVLIGDSGSQFTYLHLDRVRLAVAPGQRVARGQRIGLVSNDFAGTPTTVHLHFEIRQNLNGRGLIPVPPYMSLVRAYQAM